MQLPDCLCGAHEYKLFHIRPEPERVDVLECRRCHLARTWPAPLSGQGLAQYYEEREDHELRLADLPTWRRFSRSFLEILGRYQSSGSLLDVGCNLGILVDEARRVGYEAKGIDMSSRAIEKGKSALGLDGLLSAGTLTELAFPADSLDVISYMHCVEHLEDPLGEFQEVRRVLKPGGLLAIEVPNFFSLWRRLQGSGWYGLVPEQHIWQGGAKGLGALLRRSGFEIVVSSSRLSLYREESGGLKGVVKKFLTLLAWLTGTGDRLIIIARRPRQRV